MHRASHQPFVAARHPWIVPLIVVGITGVLGLLDAIWPGQASLPGLLARAALYIGIATAGAWWLAVHARRSQTEDTGPASPPLPTREKAEPVAERQATIYLPDVATCAHCAIRQQNTALHRANVQLQELDQLRSDLVSMVSHDLRAPLTNISGSLELMEGGCGDQNCECQRLLPVISSQTARLTRLVHGLLNVTRIEAGRLQIHRKPILISALTRQAISALELGSTAHDFEIRTPDALPLVWGDEDRLEEVLVNLLDNAIKYSPEGGRIAVDAHAGDGEVVVSVTDSGIGIAPEDLDTIFEKYHRSNGSSKSNGFGLGLYICQKLVEAHGGRIWAESRAGAGATFRFSLPAGVPAGHVAA